MVVDPSDVQPRDLYRLLISAVVPRPIAFVTSQSPAGILNLAPFSFFQGVSVSPPVVSISVARKRDGSKKDTWRNIETTGEYVIHGVTEDLLDAVIVAAAEWPETESEVERAGLETLPGDRVAVPRLARAQLAMECRLHSIREVYGVGLILGEVVRFHLRDELLVPGTAPEIDFGKFSVVSRLGGDAYLRGGEVIRRRRMRPEEIR